MLKKELLTLKKHFRISNYRLKRSRIFFMSIFFRRNRMLISYNWKSIFCKITAHNNV